MKKKKKAQKNEFQRALENYIKIKGIDIVVTMKGGDRIELTKNRNIVKDELISFDNRDYEIRIPISQIDVIDLYAT